MNSTDRTKVRVFLVVSAMMLAAAAAVRFQAPSPFAPRVHVRWNVGVGDDQRIALERQFSLLNGERRQDDTWEYDLVNLDTQSVSLLIENPAVADTHYIERDTGRVAPDAPTGRARLTERWVATIVHSFLFDWFLLFWTSSIVVSGVWLASDASARD